jgi:hypothetical protein
VGDAGLQENLQLAVREIRQEDPDFREDHYQRQTNNLQPDEGAATAKMFWSVMLGGTTLFSQKQAGPNAGDSK